jgi:putative holliday junction resolvase
VAAADASGTDARGRVLGLDLGDVRIGVAISDPERRLAVPLGTVHVGSPPGELRSIAAIVEENAVSLVVLGHPLLLSGERGASAAHAEEFAEALRAFLGVPVILHDERLSSVEADRRLADAGAGGRERRRAVDRSAATVILQAFLDANSGTSGIPRTSS